MDEPTSALDAFAERKLFDHIVSLKNSAGEDSALVLITHRLSTIRATDLIVVLAHGKIVEQGTFNELISENGHFAKLYQIQAAGYK